MKKVALPLILSLIVTVVYAVMRLTNPEALGENGNTYFLAALLVCLSIILVRLIGYVLFDIVFQRRKGREAPALLRVLISIIGYSLLFMFIYSIVLKKDLSGILATSAVLTVILGFALQDTLGNFFAGVSLHVEQPFHIGDSIRVGDLIGRVEAVTWRMTSIRTNDNTIIIFPNSKIAREEMEIFPYNNLNRRVLRFPAPYGVAPERVIEIVRETVRSTHNVAAENTPVVRIHEFADSSITYEILYWVKDYMWTPDMDARIRERVWYLFSRNGIEIPFPIRHVMLEQVESRAGAEEVQYGKTIEGVDILGPLTADERERLIRGLVRYVYAPGEGIIRRGDTGDSMFVVHRGRAEVRLPSANGDLQPVAVVEPGGYFGEMALFTGEPRSADVSALEEVEILEIRKPIIEQLLNDNARLVEAFSSIIADRQAKLAEYSRVVPEDEKRMQTQTILRRIKRFFSLK